MKRQEPARNELWRHCKGGLYHVVGFALDPDGEQVVIYQKAHERPGHQFYVQTVKRWMERHESGEWRFERADDLTNKSVGKMTRA